MAPVPPTASFSDVLARRSLEMPARTAFTWLADGENESVSLTYGELYRRVLGVANELHDRGLRGERILLTHQSAPEFIVGFWACLASGAIPVPCPYLSGSRQLPRLAGIAEDCLPALLLTDARGARLVGQENATAILRNIDCLVIDEIAAADAAGGRMATQPYEIAMLQYTSGSTRQPRGVVVSHSNLFHNQALMAKTFAQDENSVIVSWLPLHHDMGMIGNALHSVYTGARCVLMPPAVFLRDPLSWLRAISRYKATLSGGPNFAFDLCTRRATDQHLAALDLASLLVLYNGSEPVRASTMERFARRFATAGLRPEVFSPCYGLAESTLLVSGGPVGKGAVTWEVDRQELETGRVDPQRRSPGGQILTSSGSLEASRVRIVDPQTATGRACGEVGEIWVRGPSVACGYWNQPDISRETFHAHTVDGDGPFLRTGDLGVALDEQLFVTGRLKDLIIIRGRNLYPHDLEAVVSRSHPSLEPDHAIAFGFDSPDGEALAIVVEASRGRKMALAEVRTAIRRDLALHFQVLAAEILVLQPGKIPRTTSGKVQRALCRTQHLSGALRKLCVAQEGESENPPVRLDMTNAVVAVIARALQAAPAELATNVPLIGLGLDSLKSMELAQTLESELGVLVEVDDLLQGASIQDLIDSQDGAWQPRVDGLQARQREREPEPTPSAGRSLFPLSFSQEGVWFAEQLRPGTASFNIPIVLRIAGQLDTERLRRCFDRLVERHESLRTSFALHGPEPVQQVSATGVCPFTVTDLEGKPLQEGLLAEVIREDQDKPFDLTELPLFRTRIVRLGAKHFALILVFHHIISDAWSSIILIDECLRLYSAAGRGLPDLLPPLKTTYGEYAAGQRSAARDGRFEAELRFWRAQLQGADFELQIAADRAPHAAPAPGAPLVHRALPKSLCAAIRRMTRRENVTLYTLLLTAFKVLVFRYSRKQDILIGTNVALRALGETRPVIGLFMNQVPLRARLDGALEFREALHRVGDMATRAWSNAGAPWQLIVNAIGRADRRPPFRILFDVQSYRVPKVPHSEFEITLMQTEWRTSRYDLSLFVADGDELLTTMGYDPRLFSVREVSSLLAMYESVLEQVVRDPTLRIGNLALLQNDRERQLASAFNQDLGVV